MTPRVSVVIPTYNRRALLAEAIASVQQQTFKELEILVCDDGSTDGTEDEVRAAAVRDGRIRFLPGEHCGLPGTVRNRGIAAALGDWIAFLDSDDLWLPHKLERQLRVAREHPQAEFVYAHAAEPLPGGATRRVTAFNVRRSGPMLETLVLYSLVATSTVLIRRATLQRAGGFDESLRLPIAEDYELWLRLAAAVPFHFVDEDLVLYRPQPDSATADVLHEIDCAEKALLAFIARFAIPQHLAARARARMHLRRYKQGLLRARPRDERLATLSRAIDDDPRYLLAHGLRLAENLGCAGLVKRLL